jgi:hypothetical protein
MPPSTVSTSNGAARGGVARGLVGPGPAVPGAEVVAGLIAGTCAVAVRAGRLAVDPTEAAAVVPGCGAGGVVQAALHSRAALPTSTATSGAGRARIIHANPAQGWVTGTGRR